MKLWAKSVKAENKEAIQIVSKYNNYLTTEEKETILKLHNEGLNTVSIAKILRRNDSSIGRYLRSKLGVLKRRSIEWTSEEIDTIVQMYSNGLTTIEIGQIYDRCDRTIATLLRKQGVTIRPAWTRSVIVRHDYFAKIDTEAKAYFLGLLLADGSVNNKGDVSLELKAQDLETIKSFVAEIEYSGAIIPTRNCFRISFRSRQMVKDLETYGVVPNKSHKSTSLPKIHSTLVPHLIRGIFDGDGTVYRRKDNDKKLRLSFGFYGSNNLCMEIVEHLHLKFGFRRNKVFDKGTVSLIYYGSKVQAQTFYHYIYKDATLFMQRKRLVFDSYLANTEVTLAG